VVRGSRAAAVAASERVRTYGLTLALLALLFAASLRGQSAGLDLSFHAFQDSRGVLVWTPDLTIEHAASDRTVLRARFGVDVISAASDSCIRCHHNGTFNRRLVGGLGVTRTIGATKVTMAGELSRELFYSATTVLMSLVRDINKGNTSVAAGASYGFNQPVIHPSEERERQHDVEGYVSITQSWTHSTATQIGYAFSHVQGYQNNPFLRTRVNDMLTVGQSPDQRTRHALTARLRQALTADTVLDADYRRYIDSWSVNSNTASIGLSHHFGTRLVGGASYRWYDQSPAFFYAPTYTGSPEFFTADFRLFPFTSQTLSGRLALTPHGGFFGFPVGTTLSAEYERYRATTSFEAAVITAGLHVPWPSTTRTAAPRARLPSC
jgi:hypothetical protein